MRSTPIFEPDWFSTLPQEVHWVEKHVWTIENYWESMERLRSSWFKVLNKLQNADVNRLQNIGNSAIACLLPGHQKEFEETFFNGNTPKIPIQDVMISLEFIQYFSRTEEGHPEFTWDINWLSSIAELEPSSYVNTMSSFLRDNNYTDEQKLPIVIKALSLSNNFIYVVGSTLKEQSEFLRKPLLLAVALSVANDESIAAKMSMHDYLDDNSAFRLKHTIKDYVKRALPEALPLWDTLVSLDIPFEQAWQQVYANNGANIMVVLPDSLNDINDTAATENLRW